MARPPKPENANNPLRQLRALLKDPAKEGHISQKDLALLCQIPVDTIKSIEVGRLALTPTVLRNVAVATGASWDHEQGRWTPFDKTAFTFSYFSEYRSRRLNRSTLARAIDQLIVTLIHSRVDWLFENVPAESWDILRSRLDYFLEECKRDLKLTSNDRLFYTPAWFEASKDLAPQSPESQKQEQHHAARRVRQLGNVAGDKKRKRKYGPVPNSQQGSSLSYTEKLGQLAQKNHEFRS